MLLKKLFDRDYSNNFWREFNLFIVLLGVLPGIRDYSLYFIRLDYPDDFNLVFGLAILTGLISLPLSLYASRKRGEYWRMLAFLPLAVLAVGLITGDPQNGLMANLCRLAFLYFLIKGHLRSWPFAVFCLIVLMAFPFLHFLLFVGLSLLLRSMVLLVKQNWPTLRRLGFGRVLSNSLRALLLWSPMLLVIIPSLMISNYLEEKATDTIYNNSFLTRYSDPASFRSDLELSLDSLITRMKFQAHYEIDSIRESSANAKRDLPPGVGDMIRSSVVPPKSKVDLGCSWWRVDCKLAQGAAQSAANATSDAFVETGKNIGYKAEANLREFLSVGDDSLNVQLDAVDAEVDRQLDLTRDGIYGVTINSYRLLLLILLLMDIGFFFVVIKSFTYVLARVTFSRDHGTYISLGDENKMPNGIVHSTGGTYQIPAEAGEDFYISRKYEPSGRAPKISLPQWSVGIIGRLASGSWAMNHVRMTADKSPVAFNAAVGIEFVEWEIVEGETVIFSFGDFVAMSEGVKLSRIISLRLESMLLGKMFFSAATGPGKLVLRTKGNVVSGEDEMAGASVPQNRVLAWQKNTRFNVESELNVMDVFFSGVYLKRMEDDPVIINSDQTGKAKSGIGRFFLHFLLPH